MRVFVDTSAFLAMLVETDLNHSTATRIWSDIVQKNYNLFSTNYVILETIALIQRRLGMDILRAFCDDVLPFLTTIWVDDAIHQAGIAAVLSANQRQLSLVDCTSLAAMRNRGLDTVFVFDRHFEKQGLDRLS